MVFKAVPLTISTDNEEFCDDGQLDIHDTNKVVFYFCRPYYNRFYHLSIEEQKELYKNIESLWLDATNAQEQYAAAESKLKSSQASYEMVSEQFNLGMKNTVELLTEKNNLLSAQQQRIQAKYMAILDRTLLNFYAGQDIKL